MNSVSQLQQLFNYDLWSNQKTAAVLTGQSFNNHKKCSVLFAHIGAAQQIWYQRVKERSVERLALWPADVSIKQSMENIRQVNRQWLALLKETNHLDKIISYKNSKGTKFDTPLAGILYHVVIHGQHHRAQIAALLRTAGITPPGTDFIFYLREVDDK